MEGIGNIARYARDILNDGVVYVDASSAGGSKFPWGTRKYPCKTLAQARTLCALNRVNKIHLTGPFTLDADMQGYEFTTENIGGILCAAAININGKSVNGSSFENMRVSGVAYAASPDAITTYRCQINITTNNIQLYAFDCRFEASAIGLYLIDSNLYGGYCGCENPSVPTTFHIDGIVQFQGINGIFVIAGMNNAADECDISGIAKVTASASCTAGTIYTRDYVETINLGTVSVVDNSSFTKLAKLFQEQADTAISMNATNIEASVLDLSVAGTRYLLRNLMLKFADPGTDTIDVCLYQLINDVLTKTDTFTVNHANYTDHLSLFDMFTTEQIAGDSFKITVKASGGSYAVTGQYSHAKTA